MAPLKQTTQSGSPAPLFHADTPQAPALADYPALDLLADLAVHDQTQTPLTIGLFGDPGAGKSHALQTLARRARGLAGASRADGPFVQGLVVVKADAPSFQGDAASGLASALHEALLAAGAHRLAAFAVEAATDPQVAAHEAAQKLEDLRQRQLAEQQTLEELKTRRARLNETLLFEPTNNRIDDYVRRNRRRLEAGLLRFGFSGDATAVYKDLVRELLDRPGPLSRLSAFASSIWAYGRQARLLVWAAALFLLGWVFGLVERTRADWLAGLRSAAVGASEPAKWIEGHTHWLTYLGNAAITVGLLCVALNLWRASRFTMPLLQGARLLEGELARSRTELDGLIATQAKQAEQLAGEAQTQAVLVQTAERRVRERAASGAPKATNLFANSTSQAQGLDAGLYLDAIQQGLAAQGPHQRILVLLDGLEALPAQQAATLVDEVHHRLDRPGFVLALAADAAQLTAGWGGAGEAARRIERYVQAPFTIRMIRDQQASIAYAHQLLGAAVPFEGLALDASRSALDHAVKPVETHLLGKLAGLAGDTPRAVKRYLNLWRLARPLTEDGGALALMLALDNGATAGELAAMGAAMDLEEPDAALAIHPGEPRLAAALDAVNALRASPLTNGQAHEAWMIARDFTLPSA